MRTLRLSATRHDIGLRRHRLRGPEYDELVDEFISAARDVFPGVLIQFEDFANHKCWHYK